MSICTCTPGTTETNWFEERCQKCLDEESAEWARIIAIGKEITEKIRRESQ